MNEITGYIEMPFHGEKGESAYEIAAKHGFVGTEEEWVKSLGFIPDGSIGEKKLDAVLTEFIEKTKTMREMVFDYSGKYGKEEFNVYTNESGVYELPYIKKSVIGTYSVKIPKLSEGMTVFEEENDACWSSSSDRYFLAKADVSNLQGRNVRISGRTQIMPYYPLAFCVDINGNILEIYGNEDYCLYGYVFPEGYTTTTDVKEAVYATIPKGAKYLYIQGGMYTSGGNVVLNAIPVLEIQNEEVTASELYKRMQSPLWEKNLCVDGDSICFGNGYAGGFGKIIADRYNMTLVNNAVGGASFSRGTLNNVSYTAMDWENNDYYLSLAHFEPSTGKNGEGFAVALTEEEYKNGFGVYPTVYKIVDGEAVEQDYTEIMPSYTFLVKFNVPTHGGNTVERYYRMWSSNSWLWEAYRSGFASVHESGAARFGTARHWLCESAENVAEDADYVILEGGINDYLMNCRLGEMSEGMTTAVDTNTTVGALEYVCRRMLEKCIGKKLMLVFTHKALDYAYKSCPGYSTTGATLNDFHDAFISVAEKYSIPYVDLYNSSAFNTEIESYLEYTRNKDGVHPTKEGYELFYVPQIVSKLESL